MATTTATQIQQLYVGLLGRAADKSGLDWWVDQVTTGGRTLEDVRASFVTSTEYTTTYGAAATRAELVTSIYQNLFERTPSADEVKYWAETDTRPADQLVAAFIEFGSANDQKVITNKVFVAQTYTDTVGTDFNKAGATAAIANVDGTTASVNAALTAINTGTLTGQVPGVALINAVAAANAEKAAFGVATATTNPTFDGNVAGSTKDGVVSEAESDQAVIAAGNARGLIAGGADTKTITETAASTATAAKAAKDLAVASGKSAAVSAYDSAVAAQKALIGTSTAADARTAAVTAENAAVAAADVALAANAGKADTVNYASLAAKATAVTGSTPVVVGDIDSAVKLKAFLDTAPAGNTAPEVAANTLAKAALVAELAKLPTYGQAAVDAAAKVGVLDAAAQAVATTGGAAAGVQDYANKAAASATAADNLTKVTVADAAVAAAKVVADKYDALDNSIAVAKASLATFAATNSDKVTITDIAAVNSTTQATAKSDVFYFGDTKAVAANDFAIGGTTNFAAGDSIVLGTGYTFNSGALSTGNANTLEFFLVKGATGTQVVIETEAYGNSSTTVGTDGSVLASPNATVINLVGVTADHLSVANGVISYV